MNQVVSLFSGAGGLSLGFGTGGLKPDFAADISKDACATSRPNLGVDAHVLDLGAQDKEPLHRLLDPYRNCMAVVGGPPCQGFSTAGPRRADDPRNHLVFSYLDAVDYLRPRWFLFENVEGILTSGGGESLRDLAACFIARGYTLRIEKINLAGYGLPQSRKRVLIMGNRVGLPFNMPAESHAFSAGKHQSRGLVRGLLPSAPSIMDAIGDLPDAARRDEWLPYGRPASCDYAEAMRGGAPSVREHFSNPNASERERYAMMAPGHTMRDLPESAWHPSYRARAFRRVADGVPTEKRGGAPAGIRRLVAADSSPTITSAATREFIHPTADRPLTLREAARLQSFPDAFEFTGSQSSRATQIGNAVPPLAATILAKQLAESDGRAGGRLSNRRLSPGLLGFWLTDATGKSPALQQTERALKSLPQAADELERAYG